MLKQNGIKKVIASPGTTNITIVGSMQSDPYFEIYSAPDERSAAYMACGLAAECDEPVMLTCTGATASRNYIPGLTEAYYRKLPILAVTTSLGAHRVGSHAQQTLDRSSIQKDIAVYSTCVPLIKDNNDAWDAIIKINKALHALFTHGGGPVHLEMGITENLDFSIRELPMARSIKFFTQEDELPQIPKGKIAIYLGSHLQWKNEDINLIENFCSNYDAVVLGDHTSNYNGKYFVNCALCGHQQEINKELIPDLCIYLGEVSPDYPGQSFFAYAKKQWRVSLDGVIRDMFKNTVAVFEMSEHYFFKYYSTENTYDKHNYIDKFKADYNSIFAKIQDLPFSNIWIAQQLAPQMPSGCVMHFGILNSIRSWNLFELDNSIRCYCNSGGFGIDGALSSVIGASLGDFDKTYYLVVGDLAFFYDINALGNRHVGKNVRILLVNNGCGTEFKNYSHPASTFGEEANYYIAAGGHYGSQSRYLVRHYAEDLGIKYLSASTKEEFLDTYKDFITEKNNQSIIFEVFTNSKEESEALYRINHLVESSLKTKIKRNVKGLIGTELTNKIKNIVENKMT